MRKKTGVFGAVTLMGSLLGIGAPSPASATHVSCGGLFGTTSVFSANTTMDQNLTCLTDRGIALVGANFTFDLGGFTLSGDCATRDSGDAVGIEIIGEGITVRNGTVKCFDAGIVVTGGANNSICAMTITENKGPQGANASDYGDGIQVVGSAGNKIVNNVITDNGPFDGVGLRASTGNVVGNDAVTGNACSGGNTVSDNDDEFSSATMQDVGIRLEQGSSANTVENNLIERNGLDGISSFNDAQANTIRDNDVNDNGNHAKAHRKGDGIVLFGCINANSCQSGNHSVTGNTADENGRDGIANYGFHSTVSGNNADLNGRYGFSVGPNAITNTISGNTAATNTTFDAFDANGSLGCSVNSWSGNTFGTKNPSCIS